MSTANKDGIISADEKASLFTCRTNTFMENVQFVNQDKIIAEEEKLLLETLSKILEQLDDLENEFTNF